MEFCTYWFCSLDGYTVNTFNVLPLNCKIEWKRFIFNPLSILDFTKILNRLYCHPLILFQAPSVITLERLAGVSRNNRKQTQFSSCCFCIFNNKTISLACLQSHHVTNQCSTMWYATSPFQVHSQGSLQTTRVNLKKWENFHHTKETLDFLFKRVSWHWQAL